MILSIGATLFRLMASDAKFVAVKVPEIRSIVVGVILRPKAWLPFARAAIFQRDCVYLVNYFSGVG